jgi:hypothetical protein
MTTSTEGGIMDAPMIGQRVRFTSGPLGSLLKAAGEGLGPDYQEGDTGTVVAQLPADREGEGWWAVEPDGHPELYVPVRPGMIEEVGA